MLDMMNSILAPRLPPCFPQWSQWDWSHEIPRPSIACESMHGTLEQRVMLTSLVTSSTPKQLFIFISLRSLIQCFDPSLLCETTANGQEEQSFRDGPHVCLCAGRMLIFDFRKYPLPWGVLTAVIQPLVQDTLRPRLAQRHQLWEAHYAQEQVTLSIRLYSSLTCVQFPR